MPGRCFDAFYEIQDFEKPDPRKLMGMESLRVNSKTSHVQNASFCKHFSAKHKQKEVFVCEEHPPALAG